RSTSSLSRVFSACSEARSAVICCSCCIMRASALPVRCVCASAVEPASARAMPASVLSRMLMAPSSELAVQVQLPHVDAERRIVDLVRSQVAQAQPGAARQPQVEADLVTLGVGAAEVKVGIGERVEHSVALQVAIDRVGAPVPQVAQHRLADSQARLVAFG